MFFINPDISIVVPVYNSEKTLKALYFRLNTVMVELGLNFELILVDDHSGDSSFIVMEELRKVDNRVKIIKLAHNYGQHEATLCGLNYSRGEVVITMDDDLQHPPEEIPHLLAKLEAGHDVVFGVPIIKEHSWFKNIGSKLIDISLNIIVNKPKAVKVSSFRLLRRELVVKMLNEVKKENYLAALILNNALSPGVVLIKHEPRKWGKSNYNFIKSLKLASKLWLNYSLIPQKIINICWLIVLLLFISIKIKGILIPTNVIIGGISFIIILTISTFYFYRQLFNNNKVIYYEIAQIMLSDE